MGWLPLILFLAIVFLLVVGVLVIVHLADRKARAEEQVEELEQNMRDYTHELERREEAAREIVRPRDTGDTAGRLRDGTF